MPTESREYRYTKDEILELVAADFKSRTGFDVQPNSINIHCVDSNDNNPARLNCMSIRVEVKDQKQ